MTERTKPRTFVVHGFRLDVRKKDGSEEWAAECYWDEKSGAFVLESNGPGNFDWAPCDLEELARILRAMPRQLAPPSAAVEAPAPGTAGGGSSGA